MDMVVSEIGPCSSETIFDSPRETRLRQRSCDMTAVRIGSRMSSAANARRRRGGLMARGRRSELSLPGRFSESAQNVILGDALGHEREESGIPGVERDLERIEEA